MELLGLFFIIGGIVFITYFIHQRHANLKQIEYTNDEIIEQEIEEGLEYAKLEQSNKTDQKQSAVVELSYEPKGTL